MCIESIASEDRICPCGCGQQFPVYSGRLKYGPGHEAYFAVAHMEHCDSGPHVWFLLGSGPWFDGDTRNCWVTMHLFTDEENVITRIEDPQKSPFWHWQDSSDRYLTRDEVLSQEGGKDWAINRRLDFENHHPATAQFLRGDERAQQSVQPDRREDAAPG